MYKCGNWTSMERPYVFHTGHHTSSDCPEVLEKKQLNTDKFTIQYTPSGHLHGLTRTNALPKMCDENGQNGSVSGEDDLQP